MLERVHIPPLGEEEVQVWLVELDMEGGAPPEVQSLLDADERARAARFHFHEDRVRYAAGRGALRWLLSQYAHENPAELRFRYGPQGKPFLAGAVPIEFNVAHSGVMAALAFSRRPVGVDVERMRGNVDFQGVARLCFSSVERQHIFGGAAEQSAALFYQYWARKEAWMKADGRGLALPIVSYSVVESEEPGAYGVRPCDAGTEWIVRDLAGPPGYQAAVAARGPRWRLAQFRVTAAQVCGATTGLD